MVAQDEQPEETRPVKYVANQNLDMIGHDMAAGLEPNPSLEQFRFAAYTATC